MNSNGTLQYTYYAVGNKLSIVDPGKSLTTSYAYDADDRLQQVTHPGGAVTTYTYDKVGNRQSVVRPNHVTTTYTYDHLNRLTDVVNANAATRAVVSSYHYTLDADGKRLSVTDNTGATTTYGYDADSRLTSETTPGGTTSYTYDSVGNRLTKTSGGTTTTFTYDADDRNSSSAYTYNANGDVLNDGTHTFSYDFEDHLTGSGMQSGQTATYAYDADGNRIQKIDGTGTVNYLVDCNRTYAEVLEERDGSGNVLARYDYGDDLIRMDRGSSTRYYLFDGLGSTRQLTDGTGAVTDTYAYDAFGNLTSQTGSTVNPYLFNGQEQDAGTGLYYLRARYMNPQDGRFISQDPYGGDNEDPISLHRYLYASANPVNRVDLGGQEDTLLSTVTALGVESIITIGVDGAIGGGGGFSVVGAAGGNLEQRISGAIAGTGIGLSLSFAYLTGRGPQTLVSGFLGGFTSLVIANLVHPQEEEVSPADNALAFIRGFSSSAVGTALDDFFPKSIFAKAGISALFSVVGNIISFSIQDYNALDNGSVTASTLWNQAITTLVDASVSGLLSSARNGAKGPDGENVEEAVRGLSPKQINDLAFDFAYKQIQFCVKSLEKAVDLSAFDGRLDPSYE